MRYQLDHKQRGQSPPPCCRQDLRNHDSLDATSYRRLRTLGASAIKREFVGLDREAFRGQRREIFRTIVYVENPIADATLKVMVVTMPGGFIARRSAGELYHTHFFFFDHQLEISIDRGNAQPGNFGLRELLYLQRQQRVG